MKARILFIALISGILALLIVAALLTVQFMDIADKGTPAAATRPPAKAPPPPPTVVAQEIINAPTPATPAPKLQTPPPHTEADNNPTPPPPLPLGPMAQVTTIAGRAMAIEAGGTSRTLSLKSEVHVGETIQTLEASRVVISFYDNTSLEISEKSSLVLEEYMFQAQHPESASFMIRIVQGMCRVISGTLTSINPDRFRVRTRMATIGIRGCELAFSSEATRDNIYILALGGKETVIVETSQDGRVITDNAGKSQPVEATAARSITVQEPMTLVSIETGIGPTTRRITPGEFRDLQSQVSHENAMQHETETRPAQTTFSVQSPDNQPTPPEETNP